MSQVFSQEYQVRWSDLDPNFHVRHTSYADLCASVRFEYLEKLGYGIYELGRLQLGPVLFNENITYMKEVRPGDRMIVNVAVSGLSQDGRKFKMYHEIFRKSDGALSATLEVTGAWFNLATRKMSPPPEALLRIMSTVPKAANFTEIK